jgi:hypothetical protein
VGQREQEVHVHGKGRARRPLVADAKVDGGPAEANGNRAGNVFLSKFCGMLQWRLDFLFSMTSNVVEFDLVNEHVLSTPSFRHCK